MFPVPLFAIIEFEPVEADQRFPEVPGPKPNDVAPVACHLVFPVSQYNKLFWVKAEWGANTSCNSSSSHPLEIWTNIEPTVALTLLTNPIKHVWLGAVGLHQ